MSEWILVPTLCRHCGKQMEARRKPDVTFSLAGLYPLDFRHAATGLPTCTQHFQAQPYDGWRASREYNEARDAAVEFPQ